MGSGYPPAGMGWVVVARAVGSGWVGLSLAWVGVGLLRQQGSGSGWVGSHGPWVEVGLRGTHMGFANKYITGCLLYL